jgi:hypothetical protein
VEDEKNKDNASGREIGWREDQIRDTLEENEWGNDRKERECNWEKRGKEGGAEHRVLTPSLSSKGSEGR